MKRQMEFMEPIPEVEPIISVKDEEGKVIYETNNVYGNTPTNISEESQSTESDNLFTQQLEDYKESLSAENLIYKPIQHAFHFVFTLGIQVAVVLIILSLILKVAEGLLKGSKRKWVQYLSYDKESYNETIKIIHYFKDYKKFRLQMYAFAYVTRWKYGKQVSALFEEINQSPYKKEPMYQYELIQLIPGIKQLGKSLNQHKLTELIQRIEVFNQNYWHIDF